MSATPAHVGRIPVPAPEELREDAAKLIAGIARPGGEPARTMAILARQPDLLAPFLSWAATLALQGVLSHRDHELIALRVASNCASGFEWTEHSEYTRQAGLSEREIALVACPLTEGSWTPSELALLSATDELGIDCDISDDTWTELARHFDAPALVEILFVAGQYTMLSMVANAAGLDSVRPR